MNTVNESYIKWIRPPLDELIQQAEVALEEFSAHPDQPEPMASCAERLHRIHGTLQMVELYGVGILAEEMEQLAQALRQKQVSKLNEAIEALMAALVRLPGFLDRVQQGAADSPMAMLSLLNDLRAARDASLVTGLSLFGGGLDERLKELQRASGTANPALPKVAQQLRVYFHRGQLLWFRNPESQDGLKLLLGVLDRLAQHARTEQVQTLFLAAGAVAQSLIEGALEGSVAVKRLMGKIDREIKQVIDGGEQAVIADPEPDLFKNLLFYCAQSTSDDSRVRRTRERFELEAISAQETGAGQPMGLNQELMDSVSAAVKEDLLKIKDEFDLFIQSGGEDNSQLHSIHQNLGRLADTIGMLGQGGLRLQMKRQAEQIQEWLAAGVKPSENQLMDVAAGILSVELALQHLTLGGGGVIQAQDTGMAVGELAAITLRETSVEMAHIKETIALYLERPAEAALLSGIPGRFRAALGALTMLQLDEPAAMLSLSARYVAERLGKSELPAAAELETMADLIASIEYFMESVAQGLGLEGQILAFARDAQGRLSQLMAEPKPGPVLELAQPFEPTVQALGLEATEISLEAIEPEAAPEPVVLEPVLELTEPVEPAVEELELEPTEISLEAIEPEAAPEPVVLEPVLELGLEATEISLEAIEPEAAPEPVVPEPVLELAQPVAPAVEDLGLEPTEISLEAIELEAAPEPVDLEPVLELAQPVEPAVEELELEPTEIRLEAIEPEAVPEPVVLEPVLELAQPVAPAVEDLGLEATEISLEAIEPEAIPEPVVPEPILELAQPVEPTVEALGLATEISLEAIEPEALPEPVVPEPVLELAQPVEPAIEDLGLEPAVEEPSAPALAQAESLVIELAPLELIAEEPEPSELELVAVEEVSEPSTIELAPLAEEPESEFSAIELAEVDLSPPEPDDWREDNAPPSLIEEEPQQAAAVAADEDFIDTEILDIFFEEANEELVVIQETLPRWLLDPLDTESLARFRRSFHTLKGSGRLVGVEVIGEFAWSVENLLNKVINGSLAVDQTLRDLMREVLEVLPLLIDNEMRHRRTPPEQYQGLMERAFALATGEPRAAPKAAAVAAPSIEPEEEMIPFDDQLALTDRNPLAPKAHPEAEDAIEFDESLALGKPEPVADRDSTLYSHWGAADSEAPDTVEIESQLLVGMEQALRDGPPPPITMDEALKEIFDNEALGHLASIDAFLQACDVEAGCAVDETVLRALHTLAGSAHMAEVTPIAKVAKANERLLEVMKEYAQPVHGREADLLRVTADLCRAILGMINLPGAALPNWRSHQVDLEAALVNLEAREETPDNGLATMGLAQPEPELTPEEVIPEPFGLELTGDEGPAIIRQGFAPMEPEQQEEILDLPGLELTPDERPVIRQGFGRPEEEEDLTEQQPDAALLAELEVSLPEALAPPPEPSPTAAPAAADALEEVQSEDAELLEIFLEEAQELGETMDQALQAWQVNPQNAEACAKLKRVLHTMKGAARLAGVMQIGDLSHAYESLFIAIEHGNLKLDDRVLALTRQVADHLLGQIETLAETTSKVPSSKRLLAVVEAAMRGELDWQGCRSEVADSRPATPQPPAAGPAAPAPRPVPAQPAAKAGPASTPVSPQPRPRAEAATEVATRPEPEARQESRVSTGLPATAPRGSQEMVRVRADRLDRMVNNAGEISIFRARMEQQSGNMGFNLDEMEQTVTRLRGQLRKLDLETEAQIQFRYEQAREEGLAADQAFDPLEMDRFSSMQQISRGLSETVEDLVNVKDSMEDINRTSETLLLQQSRVNQELQDSLLRTRMVSFSQVVPKLQRLVRQTAQVLGKQAELVVDGAGGDVDRSILDRIEAPLEHILRNAVSHGIEMPDKRAAAGKNPHGKIAMALIREGKEVLIRVADDGGGINLPAIRKRAIERGLLAADARVDDNELIQFLLEPGFSTAEKVTQISGRGVGMDVVSSEVKQLGGVLDIRSRAGKGTVFDIRLPSTLSLTEALLVSVTEEVFAVPHTSIEGVIRVSCEELEACYHGDREGIQYAGNSYRVRYLGEMLEFVDLMGNFFPEQRKWYPMLLVRHGEQRVAIQTDRMLGSRQIVVKSVGPKLSTVRWITGGTILADGRVALILDVSALVRLSGRLQSRVLRQGELPEVPLDLTPAATKPKLTVMVVDDSITVRKVTSRLLSRNNMHVVTAKDGVDAVALLQETMPDVMLLDIEMPRMDGYELTRHIRHSEEFKKIPIIMITSRTGEKHREHAFELGVNLYLGKPYQEAQLLDSIRTVLKGVKR